MIFRWDGSGGVSIYKYSAHGNKRDGFKHEVADAFGIAALSVTFFLAVKKKVTKEKLSAAF